VTVCQKNLVITIAKALGLTIPPPLLQRRIR
jgi:hypothetical protein